MSAPAPHSSTVHAPSHAVTRPLFSLDAGWLFLIAGIAVIAATVLIPAAADLDEAYWQRNKALAIERHRLDRLERYGQYLSAVQRGDEDVTLSLMATQLNRSPVSRVPLTPVIEPGRTNASPFPSLEPDPLQLPDRLPLQKHPSMLLRLTTNDHQRLWLMAAGVVCMLIGLLPPVVRRWDRDEDEPGEVAEQ
jgi:hypothetical protein